MHQNNAHYRQAFIEYEQKDEIELKNLKHCVDSWKMAQIESKPLTIVRNEVMKRIPKWISERQAHELYNFHL